MAPGRVISLQTLLPHCLVRLMIASKHESGANTMRYNQRGFQVQARSIAVNGGNHTGLSGRAARKLREENQQRANNGGPTMKRIG